MMSLLVTKKPAPILWLGEFLLGLYSPRYGNSPSEGLSTNQHHHTLAAVLGAPPELLSATSIRMD